MHPLDGILSDWCRPGASPPDSEALPLPDPSACEHHNVWSYPSWKRSLCHARKGNVTLIAADFGLPVAAHSRTHLPALDTLSFRATFTCFQYVDEVIGDCFVDFGWSQGAVQVDRMVVVNTNVQAVQNLLVIQGFRGGGCFFNLTRNNFLKSNTNKREGMHGNINERSKTGVTGW